jgi:hypothetical protein
MKANLNIDKIMNRIVRDFLILSFLSLIGIIIYGYHKENGDINAGGSYSIIDLPFLPIILIALILTEVVKHSLKADQIWLGNFTPIILFSVCFWLNPTNTFILAYNLLLVIIYLSTKFILNKR